MRLTSRINPPVGDGGHRPAFSHQRLGAGDFLVCIRLGFRENQRALRFLKQDHSVNDDQSAGPDLWPFPFLFAVFQVDAFKDIVLTKTKDAIEVAVVVNRRGPVIGDVISGDFPQLVDLESIALLADANRRAADAVTGAAENHIVCDHRRSSSRDIEGKLITPKKLAIVGLLGDKS